MVIAMVAMRMVESTIDDVIDVVTVLNGLMTAAWPMHVV